jgi:hypothetical protein
MPGTVWAAKAGRYQRPSGVNDTEFPRSTSEDYQRPIRRASLPAPSKHLYMDFAILVNFAKSLNLEVEAVD